MAGKERTWRTNPELLLVPLSARVASWLGAGRSEIEISSSLDQEAKTAGEQAPKAGEPPLDWPALYAQLPHFPPLINWGSPNQRAMTEGIGILDPRTRPRALQSWANAAKRTAAVQTGAPDVAAWVTAPTTNGQNPGRPSAAG